MNRRNFLSLAALAIAGKAAERVFPFRVYSIPKEIAIAPHPFDTMFTIEQYADRMMKEAVRQFEDALKTEMAISFYSGRNYVQWDGATWTPSPPQAYEPITELQIFQPPLTAPQSSRP